jgi:hypothetical protein
LRVLLTALTGIGDNGSVTTGGKRKGSRRGTRPRRRFSPKAALLAAGVTLAVIAWGYLVFIAIDFGGDARGGDSRAWAFLALAAVGAMACLFIGLMLVARLSRVLGVTSGPSHRPAPPPVDEPSPATIASHRHRAH